MPKQRIMRSIFASVLSLLGVASQSQAKPTLETIDLSKLLYSIPTLSSDTAELDAITNKPSSAELVFHEDEWSQVEFFPRAQLPEVKRILKESKLFEQANRTLSGWRNVYVRKIQRLPVVAGNRPIRELETLLGAKASAAPILSASGALSGRVKNGFTLLLGSNVYLYGYTSAGAIPVLAAYVGQNPDDEKLTRAFIKLSSNMNIILVDWRAQLVLVSSAPTGQVETWRP